MLRWDRWVAFKNGIGPDQFRKGQMRDWTEIMKIDNAINERKLRQTQLMNLMSKIKRKF